MDAIVFFALWAGIIFLMMRFGCGAHVLGHGGGKTQPGDGAASTPGTDLRWVPPKKDIDPVCGKTVQTGTARPSVHDGYVYYFCSRECREVFEAAPDVYVGKGATQDHRQVEHSHV
ncbi:MAG: YHS domain-containing protein [Dongiaceae bacterium]